MKISCSELFVMMLTVLFIGLKLTGYIDWSWWWVLSPIIFSIVVTFVAIVIVAIDKEKRRYW